MAEAQRREIEPQPKPSQRAGSVAAARARAVVSGLSGWLPVLPVMARVAWLVLVTASVGLFVVGLPARAANLHEHFPGRFPAAMQVDPAGQVVLAPWSGQALSALGVLHGDMLVAVDGVPINTQAGKEGKPLPDGWLSGPVGSTRVIEVRTGDAAPRQYTVTLGGPGAADLASLRLSDRAITSIVIGTEIFFALVFLGIAALLFVRKSGDWLILLISATLVVAFVGSATPVIDLQRSDAALRAPLDCWFSLAFLGMALFFHLFPTGRFVSRWSIAVMLVLAGAAVVAIFYPGIYPWHMMPLADFLVLAAFFGSGVLSQVTRYLCNASATERQQTKWVVFGATAAAIGLALWLSLEVVWPPSADYQLMLDNLLAFPTSQLLQVLLPVSIAVAVFRYRLFDIDVVINRTLIYSSLSACIFGIYVLIVGGLGALLQAERNFAISLLATGVIAVLFQPLRERLQRAVDRRMYGERNEPYTIITRLGKRLEAPYQPSSPSVPLYTIVETIAQALKLPGAAITLKAGSAETESVVAARFGDCGDADGEVLGLPLTYSGEVIGELLLAPRAPGERFNAADRRLLSDLARQAGVTAYAVLLSVDLERSRQRIVEAREEARRRLGSDLHDGVGHRLAALLRKSDAAARLLRDDPQAAKSLLSEVREQIRATIAEVRTLAHALHPPELELLGLVGALRERAANLDGLWVEVDVPPDLPRLSVAVEAAAYYIVQEALTNIEKHAQAKHCTVRLQLHKDGPEDEDGGWMQLGSDDKHKRMRETPELLVIEVTDDGCGLPVHTGEGKEGGWSLGMTSMAERAAELGGQCTIERVLGDGTRVRAHLPCPVSS